MYPFVRKERAFETFCDNFLGRKYFMKPWKLVDYFAKSTFSENSLTTKFCNAFELVHIATYHFLKELKPIWFHMPLFKAFYIEFIYMFANYTFPWDMAVTETSVARAGGTLMHLFVCKLATNLLSRNHTFFSTDKLFFPLRAFVMR